MKTPCRTLRIVQMFMMIAVLALGTTPALAVHNDGIFQLDGDAKFLTCGTAFGGAIGCTGDDWDTLYTCAADGTLGCTKATPGVGNSAAAISDLVVDLSPLTIFRGGGSKDEKDITEWSWTDGSVPDKDDLIEAFAALYEPTTGPRADHKLLYFGANRLAVNGDAQIGFWFLQSAVSLKSDGTFQDAFGNPAHHAEGDVLILSNFVQGGGSSNIQVYKVVLIPDQPGKATPCPAGSVETGGSLGDVCLAQVANGTAGANGVCNSGNGILADSACAATNGAVVDALDPDFTAKAGANTGQYPIVGFFEGGLDLTNLGLGGECFPTFVVETRSSQSITAVLKDFTLGQFERCEAAIRTEIHSAADDSDNDLQGTSVGTGTSIHDLAIVTGTAGAPVPTGNVTFNLYSTLDCTGASTTEQVNLIVGANDARADSTAFNTSPGSLSFTATYNGDGNYPGGAGPSTCEPLTVNKFTSSIATSIINEATSGDVTDNFIDINNSTAGTTVAVHDEAVVSGAGPTPTGTVTFTRFSNADCTGTSSSEDKTLSSGTAVSSTFNLGATGLSYRATYGGDDNYQPSSASRCEPVCAINSLIE